MSILTDSLNGVAAVSTFTPINKGFSWVDSLTGGGAPLPSGEALASTTLGIRPDGNASFSLGNYQYLVLVPAPATTETLAQVNAAIAATLPPGNYWANAKQTDTYNGQSFTSLWGTAEVPFAVIPPGVAPDAPTGLTVA